MGSSDWVVLCQSLKPSGSTFSDLAMRRLLVCFFINVVVVGGGGAVAFSLLFRTRWSWTTRIHLRTMKA